MNVNKISVVLPVYNGEKRISKAIESILNQTYQNFELIIVNDCSTDNTLQIISKYASMDSRITILSNKINQKLPQTLNNGFAIATGEYLTWTSDDNSYHPTAFSKMVEVLNTRQDVELVYADYSIVDMNGNIIKIIKEDNPEDILYHNIIGACFLYRRSLAEKVGMYDPNTFLAEDYEFFIRCYQKSHGKFYHLAENLYDYGRHDASLSSTRQVEIMQQTFLVKNMHFDFLLSECNTQENRNRFFLSMLANLPNAKERKRQRRYYYSLDTSFACTDKKMRMRTFFTILIQIPHKVINRIKQ